MRRVWREVLLSYLSAARHAPEQLRACGIAPPLRAGHWRDAAEQDADSRRAQAPQPAAETAALPSSEWPERGGDAAAHPHAVPACAAGAPAQHPTLGSALARLLPQPALLVPAAHASLPPALTSTMSASVPTQFSYVAANDIPPPGPPQPRELGWGVRQGASDQQASCSQQTPLFFQHGRRGAGGARVRVRVGGLERRLYLCLPLIPSVGCTARADPAARMTSPRSLLPLLGAVLLLAAAAQAVPLRLSSTPVLENSVVIGPAVNYTLSWTANTSNSTLSVCAAAKAE